MNEPQISVTDLTKAFKEQFGQRNDEFTRAVFQALHVLGKSKSTNAELGGQLLLGCVDCERRQDLVTARLLLYISGAVVDPLLAGVALAGVQSGTATFMREVAVAVDAKNN